MDITGIIELVIIVVLILLIIGAFVWGHNHHKSDADDEENPFTYVTVYVECTRDHINDNIQSYLDRGFYIAATYPEPKKVKKNEVTEFTLILKRYAEDIPEEEMADYKEYKKTHPSRKGDDDDEDED
ncbi:MAG: hypothetical protein LUD51_05230 [Clostridia bacterium]|nr:hypothetical protein [Clostridia bacterium]